MTQSRYIYVLCFSADYVSRRWLEEAGWRYILQPELDKKYGFIISAIIVAPIWAIWRLPLFFIPGVDSTEQVLGCSQYLFLV
ncbi:MAG: CPBP family intramembrane metalloprotease [Treponema sp.]|nr:CPBP family intramembrane metalloprotease [Treponema sp.]